MFFHKYAQNKLIRASYLADRKTKHLITKLKINQVAVINHKDLDEIAANGLIAKKVKSVINFSETMTGTYPTIGLKILLDAKVPVYDVVGASIEKFVQLSEKGIVEIDLEKSAAVFVTSDDKKVILELNPWTINKWKQIFQLANINLEYELNHFIDNTLSYAMKEKDFVLKSLNIPRLKTKIKGKHVVVVVRGSNYLEDLQAIKSYINDYKPILIGVDGGADALLENGFRPNMIIGDMDSVSDKALQSSAEIIVHAYPNGDAPGLKRVEGLGIEGKIIPSVGTSEDIAMLLAFEQGAEIIVALGTHSNMIDFLEKGRKGMASTILVRMKIGTKLVDAKGVSKLYQPRMNFKYVSILSVAALTPILAIGMINQDMVRLFQIIWLNIKMIFM